MFRGRLNAFCLLAVIPLLVCPLYGQSVISTHSGVVHYFEGSVYLGDQLLESHLGKFSTIPQGGELRTEQGRAEVLLTPGVFLRVGDHTAIRMLANQLSDTRVELLSGSAMVDSAEPTAAMSITLLYKSWSMRFPEQGLYRIDSDPARLRVIRGKAEVSGGSKSDALLVSQGMSVPLAQVLVPDRFTDHPHDMLGIWAEGRQQSISADNAIAANIQDPASLSVATLGLDSFTSFPMLGLSSVSPASSGVYGPLSTYQPGFNSIYLPGYTYFPNYTYLLLLPATVRSGVSPISIVPTYAGGSLAIPLRSPHSAIGSTMPVQSVIPRPLPVQPIAPRPAPVGPVTARPSPVGAMPARPAAPAVGARPISPR